MVSIADLKRKVRSHDDDSGHSAVSDRAPKKIVKRPMAQKPEPMDRTGGHGPVDTETPPSTATHHGRPDRNKVVEFSERHRARMKTGIRTMNWYTGGGFAPSYTPEQMIDALKKSGGSIAGAARILGCTDATVFHYIDRHASVKEIHDQLVGDFTSMAHSVVMGSIEDGEVDSAKWYLSRRDPRFKAESPGSPMRGEITFRVVYDAPPEIPDAPMRIDHTMIREPSNGHELVVETNGHSDGHVSEAELETVTDSGYDVRDGLF